jgi:hypothetical protein
MPDLHLPLPLARRVLAGEFTVDQAKAIKEGGNEAEALTVVRKVRQRENRGEDGLNQTERRYCQQVLDPRVLAGEIEDYVAPCPIKVRVGPTWGSTFTPDVLVVEVGRALRLVDVKAGMTTKLKGGGIGHKPLSQDDARAKIHAASALYPFMHFTIAYPIPKAAGGGWEEKEV